MNNKDLILEVIDAYQKNAQVEYDKFKDSEDEQSALLEGYLNGIESLGDAIKEILETDA